MALFPALRFAGKVSGASSDAGTVCKVGSMTRLSEATLWLVTGWVDVPDFAKAHKLTKVSMGNMLKMILTLLIMVLWYRWIDDNSTVNGVLRWRKKAGGLPEALTFSLASYLLHIGVKSSKNTPKALDKGIS